MKYLIIFGCITVIFAQEINGQGVKGGDLSTKRIQWYSVAYGSNIKSPQISILSPSKFNFRESISSGSSFNVKAPPPRAAVPVSKIKEQSSSSSEVDISPKQIDQDNRFDQVKAHNLEPVENLRSQLSSEAVNLYGSKKPINFGERKGYSGREGRARVLSPAAASLLQPTIRRTRYLSTKTILETLKSHPVFGKAYNKLTNEDLPNVYRVLRRGPNSLPAAFVKELNLIEDFEVSTLKDVFEKAPLLKSLYNVFTGLENAEKPLFANYIWLSNFKLLKMLATVTNVFYNIGEVDLSLIINRSDFLRLYYLTKETRTLISKIRKIDGLIDDYLSEKLSEENNQEARNIIQTMREFFKDSIELIMASVLSPRSSLTAEDRLLAMKVLYVILNRLVSNYEFITDDIGRPTYTLL